MIEDSHLIDRVGELVVHFVFLSAPGLTEWILNQTISHRRSVAVIVIVTRRVNVVDNIYDSFAAPAHLVFGVHKRIIFYPPPNIVTVAPPNWLGPPSHP
jgi:hypothetical protein